MGASEGQLFRMVLEGFWMDVGQPKDYLVGQCLKLNQLQKEEPARLAKGPTYKGSNLVDPSASIGSGCVIGPHVVVGPNVVIGDGCRLRRCTIMGGVQLSNGAYVADSIVGWGSRIGAFARVQDNCVLGEDTTVPAERFMRSTTVCPH